VPVVTQLPLLSSPPTNVFGLVQFVAGRIPGYDVSEYLRELNSAYIHFFEEVSKLKNHYFTNQVVVSVSATGANQRNFDLLYNADGNLSAAVDSRLYQITRIRVQPPSGGLFQTCTMTHFNDPEFTSIEANNAAVSTQTGPYYFIIYGHGRLRAGIPLAQGSNIEFTYSYWPLALSFMSSNNPTSSVSSIGSTVTGVSSTFTQIVQPDFQPTVPTTGVTDERFMQAELVCNGQVAAGGQVYRVAAIASDTVLSTMTPIAPALAGGSAYVLATVPEIPREHIRVIASIALAKLYSVVGDDDRVKEWTAISSSNIQMAKDSLIERQSNNPPKKLRFPFSISKKNRMFMR
jgi:hypothetical protein